jgi:16S rRNA (uracil1498-N3)-methyltransferase
VDPDPWSLTLALALVRAAAFEMALEKAVEIGVTRITPFHAARSNAAAPRHADRWQRIIVEAAKQAKRFRLPVLDAPQKFEAVLAQPAQTRVMFVERGGGPLRPAVMGSPALYLIGPEGGWTEQEIEKAREKGFAAVSLGEAVLKAETAAIVGGALLRYEFGQTHAKTQRRKE